MSAVTLAVRRVVTRGVLILAVAAGGVSWLSAQGAAGGSSQAPDVYTGTYDWGNHFYETRYTDSFVFDNTCDRPVTVTFDSRDVPFLVVAPRVDVQPGSNKIPITLETPRWPSRPECTDLKGTLVVESTGYESEQGVCRPSQRSYTVTAHAHWWDRPGPPPKLKTASPDPCTVWWNTGARPPGAPGLQAEQCVDVIRALAASYRERVLESAVQAAPAEWSWLPTSAAMLTMSVEELLQMKQRAAAQYGGAAPR